MQEISGTDDQRQGVQECHREREKKVYNARKVKLKTNSGFFLQRNSLVAQS